MDDRWPMVDGRWLMADDRLVLWEIIHRQEPPFKEDLDRLVCSFLRDSAIGHQPSAIGHLPSIIQQKKKAAPDPGTASTLAY